METIDRLILTLLLASLSIIVIIFFSQRIRSVIFLLPAWFSPHTKLRVFFHWLRGVKIGKSVEIGYYVHLDNQMPNLITIHDNVTITNNCVLTAHDHSKFYSGRGSHYKVGKIVIEEYAFIGSSSIVLPGIKIGKNAIIGAGSVVTKDVNQNTLVAGNPAREIHVKN